MPQAIQITLVTLVLIAAGFDIRYRRIPNWLTYGGLVTGFALQSWLFGWAGVKDAALGALAAFVLYFGLFALRAMSAGDVKLMTAVGALVGPMNWLYIFLVAAICGAVIVIVLTLLRGTLLQTLSRVLIVLGEMSRMRAPYEAHPELDVAHPNAVTLPHAVPIALGCMLCLSAWR